MPTSADHLPLARAHLRLVEGSPPAPAPRLATILVALVAALVLAAAAPATWAAVVRANTERPAGTLPAKVVPAFGDLDVDAV
jgi:hypothetical protein